MNANDKRQRWKTQYQNYQNSLMLDIEHKAWRIYNNCRPFRGESSLALNMEYASKIINGFVTNKAKEMARDLMQIVEI